MSEKELSRNDKLRQARRRRLLTIAEAAELIGVSTTSFGRWERGVQKPHLSTLKVLCREWSTTPEELGF